VDNQSKHWAGERDSPCRPYGSHLGVGRFAVGSDLVGRRRRCCCCCCRCVIVIKIVVNVDGNARCRGGVILKIGRKHHWVDAIGSLLLLMLLLAIDTGKFQLSGHNVVRLSTINR